MCKAGIELGYGRVALETSVYQRDIRWLIVMDPGGLGGWSATPSLQAERGI